jgi:hypothetical protein
MIHSPVATQRNLQNSYTYKQVLVRAAALAELRGPPALPLGQRRLVRIRLAAPA